ncbi:TRAP transporter small permease [Bacillus alkalicellulosilyticus]|uniref:TRAP transporter small permease n=1 Tax=Alkalihalobacterium alkalicellulosilyticum TaxID=1912214 RepID=UPI001FE7ACD8|nr:TRAP transporter small permease [Bacillus alkalicellulosilyticus]
MDGNSKNISMFRHAFQTLDWLVLKIEEIILSFSIIIITVMIAGNVFSRILTNKSWAFAYEVSQFAVMIATFMGISYAARKGRHISMSAFYDMAPFPIRKALSIIIPFFTAIILLVLAYYAYGYLDNVRNSGRISAALEIPVYYFLYFVPIGLILGAIQFLRNMWINIKEKEVYLATEKKDYS